MSKTWTSFIAFTFQSEDRIVTHRSGIDNATSEYRKAGQDEPPSSSGNDFQTGSEVEFLHYHGEQMISSYSQAL